MRDITQQEKEKIEKGFINRCKSQKIKFKSKEFYKMQREFFCGAMTALDVIPPHWNISIISGREIVTY